MNGSEIRLQENAQFVLSGYMTKKIIHILWSKGKRLSRHDEQRKVFSRKISQKTETYNCTNISSQNPKSLKINLNGESHSHRQFSCLQCSPQSWIFLCCNYYGWIKILQNMCTCQLNYTVGTMKVNFTTQRKKSSTKLCDTWLYKATYPSFLFLLPNVKWGISEKKIYTSFTGLGQSVHKKPQPWSWVQPLALTVLKTLGRTQDLMHSCFLDHPLTSMCIRIAYKIMKCKQYHCLGK